MLFRILQIYRVSVEIFQGRFFNIFTFARRILLIMEMKNDKSYRVKSTAGNCCKRLLKYIFIR